MPSSNAKLPGVVGRPDSMLWVDPMHVHIVPNENPRTEDLALDELKPLIAAHGFRQDRPISVYKDSDNTLKLIDGQRRLLCVRELIAEGQAIPRIPAILLPRMADPTERLLSALAANRSQPLHPRDEARAFDRLVNFGWSLDKIAQEVGRSVNYIRDRLTLLEATPEVVAAAVNGQVSYRDAVTIVRQAERDGVPQREKLVERQAVKEARKQTPRPRNVEETITQRLARLEDDYGFELVQQIAQKRYC